MAAFPVKTALALLTFTAAMVALREVSASKGMDKNFGREFLQWMAQFDDDATPPLPIMPVKEEGAFTPATTRVQTTFLVDDSGALDHFYAALASAERGEPSAKVRVVHYGDSPTTADLITGDARQIFQQRFGNAGHGFIFVSKPWAWYQHTGVDVSGSNWHITTAVDTTKPTGLGLGGAVFVGAVGASTRFNLHDHYSQIEIAYESQPQGGDLAVIADGKEVGAVKTAGPAGAPGFQSVSLPAQANKIEVKVTSGSVRVFGVSFERSGPGVTYDSLGLNGASTVVMSRVFAQRNWAQELRHRSPDLLIINYGTNEAGFASFVHKQYEEELLMAISKVRAAIPEASILIMGPMDRGKRNGTSIKTMETIPEIIAIQERVAKETGCGFFNTFEAMGGDSTMARWYEKQPRMVAADLIHPSPKGARIVAEAFTKQLMMGFTRYKVRQAPKTHTAFAQARRAARRQH